MTKGLVSNCGIDSYELRYRATSEAFRKLLFFFLCIVEVANNLPTTATNRILPAKDQGCVPPPPPPLLIHRAVSIIHFVTL